MRKLLIPIDKGGYLPSGAQIAHCLSRQSPARKMGIFLCVTAMAFGIDLFVKGTTSPVYIIPAILASWTFRPQRAITCVFGIILLFCLKQSLFGPDADVREAILSNGVEILVLAGIATLVMSLRDFFDYVQVMAIKDPLTGLLNKAAFDDKAEAVIGAAFGSRQWLLLLALDLDGFKNVNDLKGHTAGDALLVRFAQEATHVLRRDDLLGRTGGDEFCAILRLGDPRESDVLVQEIHTRLNAILAGIDAEVTCSIGAVIVEPAGKADRHVLYQAADELLYLAKRAGRNTVKIASMPHALS